jgi:multiple sugar transport system substrate-binding protein
MRQEISHKDFLKIGGAGLAGLGALGTAACGSSSEESGKLVFAFTPDPGGGVQTLVDRFNKQNKGEIQVAWRQMPAVSDDYFEQLSTQFQSGSSDIDVIGGDVIWPAQLASQDYIINLSDRFPKSQRTKFLEAPVQANIYEGKIYGVPWFTDAGMFFYRKDLMEKQASASRPRLTTS